MPASKNTRKRTLAEADPNASSNASGAKKASTEKGSKAITKEKAPSKTSTKSASKSQSKPTQQATASKPTKKATKDNAKTHDNDAEMSNTAEATPEQNDPSASRPRRGPNGELFLPHALPLEAMHASKAKIFPPSVTGIDGIPGRPMSSGDEKWWTENREWLEKNAKALKLNEEAWRNKAADTGKKMSAKEKKESEKADRRFEEAEKKKGKKDYDWVCVCRPSWDVKAEKEDDSDAEDEEEPDSDDEASGDPCGAECKANQLASFHKGYPWIRTLKGADRFLFWVQEQYKRDQDEFDMYINNDFSGYGTLEVVQNQIAAFDKAWKNAKSHPLDVWAELEGMAFFLNFQMDTMFMCDDSAGIAAMVGLIGHAVLNTVHLAVQKGQFKPASEIKNLGLVLSLFIRFAKKEWPGDGEEADWCRIIVALADKHKVGLKGLANFEDTIEDIREEGDGEVGEEFGNTEGIGQPWKDALKEYVEMHAPVVGSKSKLGGTKHDITLFSAAEKKKGAL